MPREVMFGLAALLTIVSSGGLVLGFGPVYTLLVDEQQWHELCPTNSTTVCSDQEVQLQNVYSTGFLCVVLGQAVFGACLDVVGPRYTTTIASIFSIAGNVCMSLGDSRQGTDGLITAGYALIAFGGMGVLFASLQLAQLFATPSIYCGILVAAFYASGYIYVLLEIPIARASFFQGYAYADVCPSAAGSWICSAVIALSALACYLLFPVHHVSTESPTVTAPGLGWGHPHADLSKFKGLWAGYKTHIRRRDFWAFVTIGAILTLINVFAGGAIPNIVKRLEPNDAARRSKYTNYLYPLVSNSSFVFAPITGWFIERYGFRKAAYLTIVEFILLCGAMMLPYLAAQILSFALLAIAVGSLTAIQYSYIMDCFPNKLYGLLSGTVTLLVFCFCLLSYALTPLAQTTFDGNNSYVFLLLLAPTLAVLFLARHLHEGAECDEKQTHLLGGSKDADIANDPQAAHIA
ncbi:hypothetical protein ACHHYP_09812 [Achlya hypogyna]|uniref:Major Facilitator Superfamily (MFS) n=1 Tax=Achlya hypogyna TaxID=1202772 RepID=A0A1V9YME6_ACHHY|nr:hypothetical protein ACHHYP_09812 [Achlya hypogyna]